MSSFNTNNRRGVTRVYDYANGQKVAVGASSVQSSAVNSDEILVHSDVACFINVGSNPTAADSAGNLPLAAGEKFHLRVEPGQLVAVIMSSSSGSLYILPVMD